MRRMFQTDGPVMTVLGHIANFIILSVLWLSCCVPLVTIGVSTSALYYVTLKMARGEVSGVAGLFFKALRENLKSGIVFSILFGAVGALLYVDYMAVFRLAGALGTVSRVFFMALGVCWLITMLYTFPLQAQFVNTVRGTLKNACSFAIRNLRTTLAVLGFHAIPLLTLFLPFGTLLRILPLLLLLLPAAIAYLCSIQFAKVFKPFMENT